jgi:hypothetical protein
VIHDGEEVTDHLQSAAVLIASENSPPFAVTDWLVGLTSNLHAGGSGGAASCAIATVVPPTSILPDRAAPSFTLTP